LSEVKKFVESGFDVNKKDDTGYTALAWCVDMAATAAKGEAEAIIDYLLMHGAKLEFRDDRYCDILEFARACDGYVAEHIEKLLRK
jgi:ankyrin repeat protein